MIENIICNNLPFCMDICREISKYVKMEIYYFPNNIRLLILEYIPFRYKYLLNNYYYNIYHNKVIFSPFESYIRNIIRNDNYYIFNKILCENIEIWKKKQYTYRKKKYTNYFDYLNKLCIEYNCNKCRILLNNYL